MSGVIIYRCKSVVANTLCNEIRRKNIFNAKEITAHSMVDAKATHNTKQYPWYVPNESLNKTQT